MGHPAPRRRPRGDAAGRTVLTGLVPAGAGLLAAATSHSAPPAARRPGNGAGMAPSGLSYTRMGPGRNSRVGGIPDNERRRAGRPIAAQAAGRPSVLWRATEVNRAEPLPWPARLSAAGAACRPSPFQARMALRWMPHATRP